MTKPLKHVSYDPSERVSLANCPVGLFVSGAGELCLKTEYGNNAGRVDAYVVSSGEMFWGEHPQTIANQQNQLVMPATVEDAPTPPQWQPDEGMVERLETAWLIETGDHMYWNGRHANSDGFTNDPNDAVRFARFEDSERVIHWLMNKDRVFLVSREHAWIDGNTMKDTRAALAAIPEGEKK